MNHPAKSDLALHAGSDLGWIRRFRVDRHLRGCAECRHEVELFARQRETVFANAPGLPPRVNWDSLAAEMRANIRLGIAASECIAHTPSLRRAPMWRMAAVTSGLLVFIMGGWWVQRHTPLAPEPLAMSAKAPAGTVLRANLAGVGLERDGHGMTLTYAGRPALTTVSAGTHGSVNARYIDEETGQVTIHHVYSE